MKEYHHFVTGDFKSHAKYLEPKEYGKGRDNFVRACVDCLVINRNGEVLLGKRTREPHPGWWIIGGGMKPGESFEEAARRNIKRELSLDIESHRFQYFDTYSFVWSRRTEPPQTNGCHDVSITMILEISDNEAKKIILDSEYERMKWYDPKEIMENEIFHPAVEAYANDLLVHLEQRR